MGYYSWYFVLLSVNGTFAAAVYNWRWMLLAGVLPATVLLIGMSFLGDTPDGLLSKKRDEEAKAIFNKIEPDSDADAEIANTKKL